MRIGIDIHDDLLLRAMAATGSTSERATIEEGLRLLLQVREQVRAFNDLKGTGWDGNLDAIR
jgi:Arc/MetJ family transcription regulator